MLVVGGVFGFLLTVSGLGDYDTIHDGLLLENPYIFAMMGSAMAVAFAGLAVLRQGRTASPAPSHCRTRVERRHVYGGRCSASGSAWALPAPG